MPTRKKVAVDEVEPGYPGKVERLPKVEARIFWRGLGLGRRLGLRGVMDALPKRRRSLGEQ